MKILRSLLIVMATVSLSACDTVNNFTDQISIFDEPEIVSNEERRTAEMVTPCPKVEIVDELSALTEFSDASNPVDYNVISRVHLTQVESSCRYNERNVMIDLKLAFEGELGQKGRVRSNDKPFFSYPFFVAVVAPDNNIMAKEVFAAPITYNRDESKHTYYESLRQIIPIERKVLGQKYKLMIGFQLSPDQLAYNRANMVPVEEIIQGAPDEPFAQTKTGMETMMDGAQGAAEPDQGPMSLTTGAQ